MATIPVQRSMCPSYYHSFLMTENFFIFIEQPVVADLSRMLPILFKRRPIREIMKVLPATEQTRFYIVKKSTGEVHETKYFGDFIFFLHQINSYEDDGNIVVDIIATTQKDEDVSFITKI